MKIRILDNFLRLRLNQSDISNLERDRKLLCKTQLSDSSFAYSIASQKEETDISARIKNNELSISVNDQLLDNFLEETTVGIENKTQEDYRILIEKDFQCLHKRSGEDESDSFPNPLADHSLR